MGECERAASRRDEAGRRGTRKEGSRKCDADEWFIVVYQGQTIATITITAKERTDGQSRDRDKQKQRRGRKDRAGTDLIHIHTENGEKEREREQGQRWFLGRAKETTSDVVHEGKNRRNISSE